MKCGGQWQLQATINGRPFSLCYYIRIGYWLITRRGRWSMTSPLIPRPPPPPPPPPSHLPSAGTGHCFRSACVTRAGSATYELSDYIRRKWQVVGSWRHFDKCPAPMAEAAAWSRGRACDVTRLTPRPSPSFIIAGWSPCDSNHPAHRPWRHWWRHHSPISPPPPSFESNRNLPPHPPHPPDHDQ